MRSWMSLALKLTLTQAFIPLVYAQAPASAPTETSDAASPLQRLNSIPNGPVFVVLPLGEFEMGASFTRNAEDQQPAHRVRVSQAIAMAQTEITTAQYMACVRDKSVTGQPACNPPQWQQPHNEYHLKTGSDPVYRPLVGQQQPIVGVSWHNAVQYAAWLSAKTGHRYRIPTEAEWEYACRAGAGAGAFLCGRETLDELSWHYGNSKGRSHPVGSKKPNAWSLHDMSGNVWEWVADCYDSNTYQHRHDHTQATPDAAWPAHQAHAGSPTCPRVLRGGAWDSSPRYLHPSARSNDVPDMRDPVNGFRLVRVVD